MDVIRRFEDKFAELYARAPHMPADVSRWIATNIWWIMLIVAVIVAINSIILTIGALLLGALFTAGGFLLGGPIGGIVGGIALAISALIFVFSATVVVILAMAITHLKDRRKRGWYLLFIVQLIAIIFTALAFLLTFEPFTLLFNLIWVAGGLYVLFEIRDHFGQVAKKRPTRHVVDV